MADRPSGDQDPGEYGWLYGNRRGSRGRDGARPERPSTEGPRNDDPEPTRMLPTTPRPSRGSSHGGGSARGARPGVPPPTARPAPPPPRRPRHRLRGTVLIVVALWIVYLIAVPAWAWTQITKVHADPHGARPADQPGTTYLLVGSDSRRGLSKAEQKKLGVGGVGDIGQRTDTILLLHTGSGPSLLLSIPRDSLVPVPGHGTTKINAAFAYGGPKLLVKTIEQDTGVRIDHYVEIGFGGFVNSVDAVGGVQICPTQNMDDPRANLHIKKGCQHVDGITALGYARSRHTSALGDIARAEHQREVVSAIGSEVKSPLTILNPLRYFRVADAATSSLTISKNTGPISLLQFAWAMTRVNGKQGLTCSMPISDLAVHWDRPRALALMKLIKEDRTADITKRLCESTGLNQ